MGFGILFLGYFATTMMSIPLSRMLPIDLGGCIKLLGYILIIIAAKRLSEYNYGFKTLVVSSALMACISAFEAFVDISIFFVDNQILALPFASTVSYVNDTGIIDYVSFVATIFFIATLCVAIKQIASDTGIKKIEIAATRNFVFYCILLLLQALLFMPFAWVEAYKPVLYAALRLIELLCWLLNLYMLFSCYAKICDSNDVEMKQKPSHFEFVNKKREEQEAERQKILDEYAEKSSQIGKRGKKRKK